MLSTISTRVDSKDKKEFEKLCKDLGLNVSVAFNMIIKKAIKYKILPIDIGTENGSYIYKKRGLSDKEVKEQGLEALYRVREQSKIRKHEFTLDEINEIIAETRRENKYAY